MKQFEHLLRETIPCASGEEPYSLVMALLLQKNGDPSRARAFTNRAQRIIAKG